MSKYCVIGKSLPHTISPQIHGAFGNECYGVTELENTDELSRFVQCGEYDGYNVTIPYKRDIITMLDEVSKEAAEIGAVNTVVRKDGRLIGYNTDVGGMRYAMLKAGIKIADKNVMILGSGGTCQTASYLCKVEGAKTITVVSRTGDINYQNCYEFCDTQVIINTTPVGMMPHAYEKPVELGKFKKLEGVFDCIYNPLETLLIREARELGLCCANGLDMLVEQARLANDLFLEAKCRFVNSQITTDSVVADMLRTRKNIVLTGMAGSGKSVIGKELAQCLGREFVDTDSEIELAVGKSIPKIFAEYGEEYFRRVECEIVEKVCLRQGIIVSTGGGAILNEKNEFFMRCNGDTYLIERDVEKLDRQGRPLSKDRDSVLALYKARKPVYLAGADFVIDNNGTIEQTIDNILKVINFDRKRI